MYCQDVQSNKSCVGIGGSAVNCTCYGRGGDVEKGCYEVSDPRVLDELVLGGEAALWGEAVDDMRLDGATFMAAAVVAERLWSPRGRACYVVLSVLLFVLLVCWFLDS